jgi:hypothetical protein
MTSKVGGELPNNPLWDYERTLGDILAQLHTILEHAEVSKDHADNADLRYPEESLNQIYIDAPADRTPGKVQTQTTSGSGRDSNRH